MLNVNQAGVTFKNACFTLDMPTYLYKKNDKFFPVDTGNCQISDISTCHSIALRNEMQYTCLYNFTNCCTKPVTCKTRYIYDTSAILIGSSLADIQVFAKEEMSHDKSISIIKPSKLGTKYIDWRDVSYVQIDHGILIEQPDYITNKIVSNSTNISLSFWFNFLHKAVNRLHLTNTTALVL